VYSTFLFSPATQTWCSEGEDILEFLDEEFLIRVAPVAVPVELWRLPLFCFAESHHSPKRHYLCNNYTLFMTFGYL
jgi:hypothetical protein